MAEEKEPIMQRIQAGIFGIVLVLVVVSITNFMQSPVEVAAEEAVVSEEPDGQLKAEEEAVADEPLVELGVAPAVESEEKQEDTPLDEAELDGPNTAPVE